MLDIQDALFRAFRSSIRDNFLAVVGDDEQEVMTEMRSYLKTVIPESEWPQLEQMPFEHLVTFVTNVAKKDPEDFETYMQLLKLEKQLLEVEDN